MNILITGADGFVGTNLLKYLEYNVNTIVALVYNNSEYLNIINLAKLRSITVLEQLDRNIFPSFFETLPTRWKASSKDTGIILKKYYAAEFGHSYNIGTGTIRCVKLKQLHIDQIEYQPTDKKKDDY